MLQADLDGLNEIHQDLRDQMAKLREGVKVYNRLPNTVDGHTNRLDAVEKESRRRLDGLEREIRKVKDMALQNSSSSPASLPDLPSPPEAKQTTVTTLPQSSTGDLSNQLQVRSKIQKSTYSYALFMVTDVSKKPSV